MALKNSQYDKILNKYDARRIRAHFELEERRQEVYSRLPQIKAIDDKIIEGSVSRARLALQGQGSDLDNLKRENEALSEQKRELLKKNGYDEDYLDLHYTCNICMDTGFVNGERCECFIKEMTGILHDDSDIRDMMSRQNFDTFNEMIYSDREEDRDPKLHKTPREQIEEVLDKVQEYLENFDEEHGHLFIFGATGVGKTFLTSCIAKELVDRAKDVVYYPAYKLFSELVNVKFHRESEEEDEPAFIKERIYDSEVLIIDDLGTELPNSMTEAEFFALMNERLISGKAMIVSSNLGPEEFKNVYGERIFSRLAQNFKFIKIIGKDNRL